MSTRPDYPSGFRTRRFFNWAPLGITYALLYMGRYNLTVAKLALGDLMSSSQFGTIFGIGTVVYAISFLLNGPLTDRLGGRWAILVAAAGTAVCNLCMGAYTQSYVEGGGGGSPTPVFSMLYAANMYFQSFGAVAIVKVNSGWFHVTERGQFSAIMGAIISSGVFLAFDVGGRIVTWSVGAGQGGVDATWYVFYVPAVLLSVFFFVDFLLIRDNPSGAGYPDFDTGAARLSENEDQPIPTMILLKKILTNPIIMTVAFIELCTGVLRQGIMQWYPIYAKQSLVLPGSHVMNQSWGFILFLAGVIGGTFAGLVSDKLFQSRRAPAAGFLYLSCAIAVGVMIFTLGGTRAEVGWINSPPEQAVAAGLRAGDLITTLDGAPVADRARLIATLENPGEHRLVVDRGTETATITLRTDEATLAALSLRRNLVTVKDYGPSKVTVVHWLGALAHEVGLRKGDRILTVSGQTPTDWEDLLRLMVATKGAEVRLEVERGSEKLSLAFVYPAHAIGGPESNARYFASGPVQKLEPLILGAIAFFISLCVIGVHGLLSGTATMDFGGRRGTATAVGVIDGFVYLGTAIQSFALGYISTHDWQWWPVFMLPFAVLGFVLLRRIWHAKPREGAGAH